MKFKDIEVGILEELGYDIIPLENIVRDFAQDMFSPSEQEFEKALEFLTYFLSKHNCKILYGEELKNVDYEKPEDIRSWLRELWQKESYQDFDYAVWLSKI